MDEPKTWSFREFVHEFFHAEVPWWVDPEQLWFRVGDGLDWLMERPPLSWVADLLHLIAHGGRHG